MASPRAGKSNAPSPRPSSAPSAPPAARTPPQLDLKTLGVRLGLPIVAVWVVVWFIHHWIGYVVAGVLTALAIGLVLWVRNFTQKTARVANIVSAATNAEERKEALEKIDREFKKDDAAALFAKAQLQMHEDPREALATLEQINLEKALPGVADEARAQRAMLHLMLNETKEARALVDAIDLSRHSDTKSKATIGAVIAEAWARTGQAKKATDVLAMFDEKDDALADARPGLLRARVFAAGALDDVKTAKSAMHQLAKVDPRIVAGFAQKGVHPLIVAEAKKILERSGAIQRIAMRNPQGRR